MHYAAKTYECKKDILPPNFDSVAQLKRHLQTLRWTTASAHVQIAGSWTSPLSYVLEESLTRHSAP